MKKHKEQENTAQGIVEILQECGEKLDSSYYSGCKWGGRIAMFGMVGSSFAMFISPTPITGALLNPSLDIVIPIGVFCASALSVPVFCYKEAKRDSFNEGLQEIKDSLTTGIEKSEIEKAKDSLNSDRNRSNMTLEKAKEMAITLLSDRLKWNLPADKKIRKDALRKIESAKVITTNPNFVVYEDKELDPYEQERSVIREIAGLAENEPIRSELPLAERIAKLFEGR